MTNSFLPGLSGLILALPMAFGLQHNTRLYGTEIQEATSGVMRYNNWSHVVGTVTPFYKTCTAADLDTRNSFANGRKYSCDLYFQEFPQPASFSLRVSYRTHEDSSLIAALDAVFLEGDYEARSVFHDRANYHQEMTHLGVVLEHFDTAQQQKRLCTLRALPGDNTSMVIDTLKCSKN